MSTNNIYQDSEKENIFYANPEKLINAQGAKDKRSILAVLNNASNIGYVGQHGKAKSFRGFKIKQDRESDIAGINSSRTTKSNIVPIESFTVYEDQPAKSSISVSSSSILLSSRIASNVGENIIKDEVKYSHLGDEHNVACANISKCTITDPLKFISQKEEHTFGSPISIHEEVSSPMSIDKVLYDDENQSINTMQWITPPSSAHNDRDRFFEVIEYQKDILGYLRDAEKRHRPKPTYMRKQPHINYKMRSILIDWLVEFADEYDLHSETLNLAVSYVDRFLSIVSVVRPKLQLVGTAAMFIAAKYEEIYPPDVSEFAFITDDAYTKGQILKMEQIILRTLHFDLSVPTNLVFINAYAVLYDMPEQVKFLATYIAELSLLYGDPYLQFLPSEISSGSVALARYILHFPMWCPQLELITSYSLKDLKDIILILCQTHKYSISAKQQAIQDKYKTSKYMEVSTIEPVELNEEKFIAILSEYNESLQMANIQNTLIKSED